MASTMGRMFRLSTFGESHGAAVGGIVDGCPSRIPLTVEMVQRELDRRRPGQSDLTTPRDEADRVRILSGVQDGVTLGTPIGLYVENEDRRPADYSNLDTVPRPSHADFTYRAKYGIAARSGGGRASARETVGRVAGGAVARQFLAERHGIEIVAYVAQVADVSAGAVDAGTVLRADVDSTPVRCPDPDAAERMADVIRAAADDADSVGGIVTCVCRNVPAGWGEPVFDKLEAALGGAVLSIPACKGFEIGSGFSCVRMRGSEHNDQFVARDGALGTRTNNSGGVQGGITNGEPIVFRAAFKPAATIGKAQPTVDYDGKAVVLEAKGRHDPCVLPRAVPVVEAMAALVLADMALSAAAER